MIKKRKKKREKEKKKGRNKFEDAKDGKSFSRTNSLRPSNVRFKLRCLLFSIGDHQSEIGYIILD